MDGCVYVVDPASGTAIVPVFPEDGAIRWDGDVLRVGSRGFTLGEMVDLTGGEGTVGDADLNVPDACDPEASVFVVHFF